MVTNIDRESRFRVCLCFNVRTGTIIYGIFQILIHLACMTGFIMMSFRPDLAPSGEVFDRVVKKTSDHTPTPVRVLSVFFNLVPGVSTLRESMMVSVPPGSKRSKVEPGPRMMEDKSGVSDDEFSYLKEYLLVPDEKRTPTDGTLSSNKHHIRFNSRQFNPYLALCLSFFSFLFCIFLVSGAISYRPTHLLPFFFVQVFDFIISLLILVGYLSSTHDVPSWFDKRAGSVYMDSSSNYTFLFLFISFTVLGVKAYCLCMVWDCYKYCTLFNHHAVSPRDWSDRFGFLPTMWGILSTGRRATRGSNRPSSNSDSSVRTTPTTYERTNDLPTYEDSLKIPANAYAPPPYFGPNTKGTTEPTDPEANRSNGPSTFT